MPENPRCCNSVLISPGILCFSIFWCIGLVSVLSRIAKLAFSSTIAYKVSGIFVSFKMFPIRRQSDPFSVSHPFPQMYPPNIPNHKALWSNWFRWKNKEQNQLAVYKYLMSIETSEEYIITRRPKTRYYRCLLYTSPSPRDLSTSRMPSSA